MGVVVYLQLLETVSVQDVAEQLQYPARGKCRRNEREIKKKRQWPLLFCTNPNLNSPCSSTNTIEELQDIQEIQGKEIIVLLAALFGMNPPKIETAISSNSTPPQSNNDLQSIRACDSVAKTGGLKNDFTRNAIQPLADSVINSSSLETSIKHTSPSSKSKVFN